MTFIEGEGERVTKSFRIYSNLDKELKHEAENKTLSVSGLLNYIIEKYLNHTRWIEKTDSLIIDPKTLKEILMHLDSETITLIGESLGAEVPRDTFMIRGEQTDEESAMLLILKILGEYDGWFDASYHKDQEPYFSINNKLGLKWIIFIEAFLRSFYLHILGKEVSSERVGENLIIRI